MDLKIKKLHPKVKLPEYKHAGDAGLVLYSPATIDLKAGERKTIPIGVAMEIPVGYFGFIRERSSLASKHGILGMAGVIDAGYRGEFAVVLLNTSDTPYKIEEGDQIAQLLILPVAEVKAVEVKELTTPSTRGEGGFGSTGR